ncbi:MAG TPA: O-methyltransferase [Thermomicrobiales bacterium]|nr:O-methyltransferase [Thermomicrobiales bacterium]
MQDDAIDRLLDELYAEGQRSGGMWNVGPDGGALLAWLVGLLGARRVLEVGASNGYSAIWMARALAATGGTLVTLERDPAKIALARANIDRAGHAERIVIVEGPALASLAALGPGFDLVFIDADKERYVDYLRACRPLVGRGGIIVADNMTSHPAETAPYRAAVAADPGLASVAAPVGGGFLLSRVLRPATA